MTSTQEPLQPIVLSFQFDWNEAEHARMIRAVRRHSLTDRFSRVSKGGFLLVVLVTLVVPFLQPNTHPIAGWIAAAPWLVLLGFCFFLLRWCEPYIRARIFRLANHCARHPMRRIISAQGIRTECETTSADFRWQEIQGVVETPEFFLFYVPRRFSLFYRKRHSVVQLPKRAILTQEDLKRLRGVLDQQLGERAQLLDLTRA